MFSGSYRNILGHYYYPDFMVQLSIKPGNTRLSVRVFVVVVLQTTVIWVGRKGGTNVDE